MRLRALASVSGQQKIRPKLRTVRWAALAGAVSLAAGLSPLMIGWRAAAFSTNHQAKAQRQKLPAVATTVSAEVVISAKEKLSGLGYWIGPMTPDLDRSFQFALVAFQKVSGKARTGQLTAETLEDLKRGLKPSARETGYAHIEVDLSKQVLFFVAPDGGVSRVLPVSSGSGKLFTSEGRTRRAVTPVGRFTVQRKIKGWRKSPLGLLYYPSYINGGVAIHGNPSVPSLPASHGCIRIPMFAAKEFSEMAAIGTPVLVYDENSALSQIEAPSRRTRSSSATAEP